MFMGLATTGEVSLSHIYDRLCRNFEYNNAEILRNRTAPDNANFVGKRYSNPGTLAAKLADPTVGHRTLALLHSIAPLALSSPATGRHAWR